MLSLTFLRCEAEPRPQQRAPVTPDEARVEQAVRTDREKYEMRDGPFGPEAAIVTTFRAPRERNVWVVNCNGAINVGLQRLDGSRWVDAWAPEMNACFSTSIELAAGEERTYAITIVSRADAPDPSQRTEQRIESGTYRVVWYGVLTSFDREAFKEGKELPVEQRVSAPITIVAPAVSISQAM